MVTASLNKCCRAAPVLDNNKVTTPWLAPAAYAQLCISYATGQLHKWLICDISRILFFIRYLQSCLDLLAQRSDCKECSPCQPAR